MLDESAFFDDVSVQEKMTATLYKSFGKYPLPQDYMLRIVNNLSNPQDDWRNDSLRLRILKQFIKYGNCLKEANFGGQKEIGRYVKEKIGRRPTEKDILDNLSDEIFDRLNSADKMQKKPEGKFGLLKLADDLAAGKFRTGGATKRGLYLFAMVFGMSFAGAATSRNDIEKNLFRDYYSNNLMRFITEDYRNGVGDFELLPSGQGINYKNFAEAIYLYFLAGDYSPQEKIKLSAKMIEDVQFEFATKSFEPTTERDTVFYRESVTEMFNKPAAEFKKFILNNFDCSTRIADKKSGKIYSVGIMQTQLEQNTAQSVHRELLTELKSLIDLEDCDYGLWFVEVETLKTGFLKDAPHVEDFFELLSNVNRLLKSKRNFDSQNVTRTALLTTYYYFHNESRNQSESGRWQNFAEHFAEFKTGANFWLESAFYQPLDTKNFFDVALVFSSYAYLNL